MISAIMVDFSLPGQFTRVIRYSYLVDSPGLWNHGVVITTTADFSECRSRGSTHHNLRETGGRVQHGG